MVGKPIKSAPSKAWSTLMRRMRKALVLSAVWISSLLGAQSGKAPAAGSGFAAQQALVAEYQALVRNYQAEDQKIAKSEPWQRALALDDKAALVALRATLKPVDREVFAARALAKALQMAGDEAVPLYCQAVIFGGRSLASRSALAAITASHMKSSQLWLLLENAMDLSRAVSKAEASSFLEVLIAGNPDPKVSAWAMYWRSLQLHGPNAKPEEKLRSAYLQKQAAQLSIGTALGAKIAAPRFLRERLQVGMTAPEIEGVDTDGTTFKLSDYLGKVVVLDYWGFW